MIPASSIRVMIVDDKGMMRELTRRTLEHLGFKDICEAANPREALPVAREKRVHLIISDYHMGNGQMDGLDFLREVRQDPLLGKVAFIMLSGSGGSDVIQEAEALGANAYILKPFSLKDLRERIESVVAEMTGSRIEMRLAA